MAELDNKEQAFRQIELIKVLTRKIESDLVEAHFGTAETWASQLADASVILNNLCVEMFDAHKKQV